MHSNTTKKCVSSNYRKTKGMGYQSMTQNTFMNTYTQKGCPAKIFELN